MTFINPSPRPSRLPDLPLPSRDYGGMREAIGRGRTNPRSKTKDAMARGFMPTSLARKAIRATPPIGTTGQASPRAETRFWHFLPYLLAKGTLVNLALQRAKKTRAFLAELGIKPESAGRVPESGRGSSAQVHATI